MLRVSPFDEASAVMPEGLSARNADDRILAAAWRAMQDRGTENVALITNDLNMLLKAQTLGVRVERRFDGADGNWAKRWIIRPFQRYRIPLTMPTIQTPYETSTAAPQIRAWRASNRPRRGNALKRNTTVDEIQPERAMIVMMDHIPSDTGQPFLQPLS